MGEPIVGDTFLILLNAHHEPAPLRAARPRRARALGAGARHPRLGRARPGPARTAPGEHYDLEGRSLVVLRLRRPGPAANEDQTAMITTRPNSTPSCTGPRSPSSTASPRACSSTRHPRAAALSAPRARGLASRSRMDSGTTEVFIGYRVHHYDRARAHQGRPALRPRRQPRRGHRARHADELEVRADGPALRRAPRAACAATRASCRRASSSTSPAATPPRSS